MKNDKLGHISGKHYANIVVLSNKGDPLATISAKRCKWYLNRNLAKEVETLPPYEKTIQLNFNHKISDEIRVSDLALCSDRCVLCSNTENLSLHHVIPYVIKKHFPLEEKENDRASCVLLCTDCHILIEKATQPLYKSNFPAGIKKNKEFRNHTLQVIKSQGHLDKIPIEKINRWLLSSDYKTMDEVPPLELNKDAFHSKISQIHKRAIKTWANNFIKEHGGIEGTREYFIKMFLSFNPKFLPAGYLTVKKIH